MHWDKRKLGLGIGLLICTVICIFSWITSGYTSYHMTGSILFTIFGLGFIKSAHNR